MLVGESFGWLGYRSTCARSAGARTRRRRSTSRPSAATASGCGGLIAAGEVAACHDLADGGLLVALAEMVLASGIGADLEVPPDSDAGWLFGEDQGRYLLAVAPDSLEPPLESARREGALARRVGTTGGHALTLDGADAICLDSSPGFTGAGCRRSWPRPCYAPGWDQAMAMTADEIEKLI